MNKKTVFAIMLSLCLFGSLICMSGCTDEKKEITSVRLSVTGKILKVLLEYHFSGFKPVIVAMDNGNTYNFNMDSFAMLCLYEGKNCTIVYDADYNVVSIKEV